MAGQPERNLAEQDQIFYALQKIADAELIANRDHKDYTQGYHNRPRFDAIELLDTALEVLRPLGGVEIPTARALEVYGDVVPEVVGSQRLLEPLEYYLKALSVLKTAPDLAAVTDPIIRITQKINRKPTPNP
ncbi:hypothetical protein HYU45_04160 [Candidatus Daviesbacteria bacterium]|nr:hypothetical protein [Candidatus Daviesbacteria bacterium]